MCERQQTPPLPAERTRWHGNSRTNRMHDQHIIQLNARRLIEIMSGPHAIMTSYRRQHIISYQYLYPLVLAPTAIVLNCTKLVMSTFRTELKSSIGNWRTLNSRPYPLPSLRYSITRQEKVQNPLPSLSHLKVRSGKLVGSHPRSIESRVSGNLCLPTSLLFLSIDTQHSSHSTLTIDTRTRVLMQAPHNVCIYYYSVIEIIVWVVQELEILYPFTFNSELRMPSILPWR